MQEITSPLSSSINEIDLPRHSNSGTVTHAGDLFKLGDGYMNRSWNSRYFILRGSTLQYYTNSRDQKPREVIDMLHATVSWLGDYADRSSCIHVDPIAHRSIQVSGVSVEEARRWFRWLHEAADPQGFAEASRAPSLQASPMASFIKPDLPPFAFKTPPSLPLEFTEAASMLESLVNNEAWQLADIRNGVREYIRFDSSTLSPSLLISIAVIACIKFHWVLIIAALIAWYYYPREQLRGEYAEDVPEWTEQWLKDPSRYSVWVPGWKRQWKQLFTASEVYICMVNDKHYIAFCVNFKRVWAVSNCASKGVLSGLLAVASQPALPPPVLPTERHPKGGLCVAERFPHNPLEKTLKLGGTCKPLSALAALLDKYDKDDIFQTLLSSAPSLGAVAWTKYHPKVGETFAGEHVALTVTETSRPSQGLSVAITVTGKINGTLKYELRPYFRIFFSKSEFVPQMIIPDICFAGDGRVWWEGRAAVQGIELTIRPTGRIVGSIVEDGKTQRILSGHWLERVFLDNALFWTASTEKIPQRLRTMSDGSPRSRSSSKVVLSSHDEEALEFIGQLKLEVPEMIEKFPQRFQTEYIYRFAKARQFKLPEVRRMVLAHIEWLEEHKVDELLQFEYPELMLVKAAFPHGYHGTDKFGRPIYISRLAKTNQDKMFQVTSWDRFIKFWIQSYEDLIWHKMPICKAKGARNPPLPGQPVPSSLCVVQTVSILDIKGIGISQLSSKVREFISVTSKLASENYPEILGTMYIINSPGVFPMIWNGIKSMIDPGTRAKIHVLNAKETKTKLLEIIDSDQLPFFLGGNCKCAASTGEDSDFGCLSSDKGPWLHK